jgi:hypothetical protein
MTQEDKQLLTKDLCARLPYGVICEIYNEKCAITEKLLFGGISHFADDTIGVKPYLRPMSSMTEEEKCELYSSCGIISLDFERRITDMVAIFNSAKVVDYLNVNHFDYRGLIPKGLALEAPEGMYNLNIY